jgi:hypothetical protein
LYSYSIDKLPATRPAVWSRAPIQPLAPGALTPFSFSVLAEILGRAWYNYYDRLGFAPQPRARVLRQYQGRAYQNLTLSAQLESTHAAVQPITLLVNGKPYPVADWEKPGFLGGMKFGRAQRKIDEQIDALAGELDTIGTKAENWLVKTRETKWTQAEILQIMEEIERVSLNSLMVYIGARRRTMAGYYQLLNMTQAGLPFPANLSAINSALCDVDGLVENDIATAILNMAGLVKADATAIAWLKQNDLSGWREELPNRRLAEAMETFLKTYGHRCAVEGEIMTPRWAVDPTPVLHAVLACATREVKQPVKVPAAQYVDKLMQHVSGGDKKQAEAALQQIRSGLRLQSRALNAVAYFLAGTRRWALAAGREAAADGRLADAGDVFFFELEEMKQMMTGEWNVSDRDGIRARAEERKAAYAQWETLMPSDLLIGDAEAQSTPAALPGTAGKSTGPLRRWDEPQPHICNGAIVGVPQLDSGWAVLLPIAKGLVTEAGTPLDPVVAAARHWHTPMLLDLGAGYAGLVDGAQTTIDVDRVLVDQ